MPRPPSPLPPLIPAALALLGGAALSASWPVTAHAPGERLGWALVAGCLLCGLCGARRLLVVLAFALGCAVGVTDRQEDHLRAAQLGLRSGAARELELQGRVLEAPERTADGERLLTMLAWPTASPAPAGAPARVRLRVRPSGPAGTRLLDELRAGDRVRAWCRLVIPTGLSNPGSRDPAVAMRARGLDAVGSVKSAWLVERLEPPRPGLRRRIDDWKQSARLTLRRNFADHPAAHALLAAMLLGDRALLLPEDRRALREGGMIHLVAISGLHVGLLVMLCAGTLRRAGLPGWASATLLVLGVLLFSLTVGPRPSVARASAAGALAFAAGCRGRDVDPRNTLALLAAALTLAQPTVIDDLGFRLSFLATAGILIGSAPLSRLLPGRGKLNGATAVSLAAYLAAAPLIASFSGSVAPVAVLSNLLAVPLCGVVLCAGYGTVLLEGLPLLHAGCACLALGAAEAIGQLARIAGELPLGSIRVPRPSTLLVAIYFGLLVAALHSVGPRRWVGYAAALATLALHLGPAPPPPDASGVEVRVLDVGQAQAIWVGSPGRGGMLVDTGAGPGPWYDATEGELLPTLVDRRCTRLAALVLTHADLDHAGGAATVLRELEVDELWLGPGWHRDRRTRELANLARSLGAALVQVERGVRGELDGLAFEVLGPDRQHGDPGENDDSVVLRVGNPPNRILMPGDIEAAGERALLDSEQPLRAELLVLAHHGSRSATGNEFLDRVRPRRALASCGHLNRFGHPDLEVQARLLRRGIPLSRTDRDGQLWLESTRRGWRLNHLRSVGPEGE